MIIVIFGLPGSGKSYFAHKLSEKMGADYLGTDSIRKKLFPIPNYSEEEKSFVYDNMFSRLKNRLEKGGSIFILDGTFSKRRHREKVVFIAQQWGMPLYWIEIVAEDKIIKNRLSQQREESDADFTVFSLISREFEPMHEPHLKLKSDNTNIKQMLTGAKKYLKNRTI